MLHRVKKKNDMNHDKWLGVGGKFELGESPEECMLREVREETGLTLTRWAYRGIVTFVSGGYFANICTCLPLTDLKGRFATAMRGATGMGAIRTG